MSGAFEVLLHHSEAVDPTLIDWIRHQIDDIVGFDPPVIAAVLGVVLIAFPLALGLVALRARRRLRDAPRVSSRLGE